jgi:hypothetical protein
MDEDSVCLAGESLTGETWKEYISD